MGDVIEGGFVGLRRGQSFAEADQTSGEYGRREGTARGCRGRLQAVNYIRSAFSQVGELYVGGKAG